MSMNFTLKQLRYVEAAGRLGSIAKAAEELAISQSSVTAAIDALEHALEYDIFVRTPARGIKATPSGQEALRLIRGFIHQSRHFGAELQSLGQDATGLVRIACYGTAAPAFLPPILKSVTERFPNISMQVLEGDMAGIIEFLDQGRADLVFTYQVSLNAGHDFETLFHAPPYALISTDDPLSREPAVTYADLAERPMVMLDLPGTKEYFLGLFESRGLAANVSHSTRSAEIARALVAGGFGFTMLNILPPDYRRNDTRFRAMPIRDETQTQVFGIATLANTRQPKTVRSFIESCLELRDAGAFDDLIVGLDRVKSTRKSGNRAH